MKMHQELSTGLITVSGYGRGYLQIRQQRYEQPLLLTGDTLHELGPLGSLQELIDIATAKLPMLSCETVILGTGQTLEFPHPRRLQAIYAAGVGCEVMDSSAACRTYNILIAEGRRVAALLLLP